MSPLTNIKNVVIAAILGMALLAGGLYFAANQKSKATQKTLVNLVKKKDSLGDLKQELEHTRQSIEKLKQEQEEFKKTLFDERDVPAFLDSLSTSAAKSLVYVVEMKTQQFSQVTIPKEMEDINRQAPRIKFTDKNSAASAQEEKNRLNEMLTLAAMPIRMKIQGEFEAIVNFLNSIENYRQLLTVSNVEISRKDYPQLTCEFNLKIYSLKKLKDIKT